MPAPGTVRFPFKKGETVFGKMPCNLHVILSVGASLVSTNREGQGTMKNKFSACPWGKLRLRSACPEFILSCLDFFLLYAISPLLRMTKGNHLLIRSKYVYIFIVLGSTFLVRGGKLPRRPVCPAHCPTQEPTCPGPADRFCRALRVQCVDVDGFVTAAQFFVVAVFLPEELRRALLPTLEKLYKCEPESLPFRQPVDPKLLGCLVSEALGKENRFPLATKFCQL